MYKLLLCLRYLRTRYIALASVVSVMLGVATMIVVNSVMAGFGQEMRTRIHGLLADVVVESRTMDGIPDTEAQLEIVRKAAGQYIAAMTPTVEVPGMIHYSDPQTDTPFQLPVQLIGIQPDGKAKVGPLKDYLGNFQPEIRDGVVTREALLARDSPVTFNLTPQAQSYRDVMKQEQLYRLQLETGIDLTSRSADTGAAPIFDEPIADGQDNPAIANADLPFDIDSPLLPETKPADPGAPAAARVFLGSQIAGYDITDPETGERRKVNLVQPGDDVIITTVRSSTPPEPSSFPATVVDTFQSGMSEYDGNLVLMNIEELQKSRGMIVNGVAAITTIQIRLKNYDHAEEVVTRLRAAFPPGTVSVGTWESKQGLLLSAVEVETAILNVLLFMIIAVAGFGILAIFFMIVVEKTRDIGILKALGASSEGISSIFVTYGLGLGIVGSLAGVTLGLLFVRYINEIEKGLSWVTGRKVFDPEIYYFDGIPTLVSPTMVFWVASGAVTIAILASVLPARRASRLHPVRALRYE